MISPPGSPQAATAPALGFFMRVRTMAVLDIKCTECGSDALPKRVEIVANPERPTQIVELILVIQCPKCGWRKQPAPMDRPPGRK
jgi:hypothetical protein